MKLLINPAGMVRCLYSEEIDLRCFGDPQIERASRVEPDSNGQWFADLSPMNGPVLGPFDRRSDAIAAEIEWLDSNWLMQSSD